jgi:hypothetical protein
MTVMKMITSMGLAVVIALNSPLTVAAEQYSFARPPAPESTVDPPRLSLHLDRYSTDAERARLQEAIADRGPEHALQGLSEVPYVGRLTWPGGTEYSVRYARQNARPDGGRDVILLLDRPLWIWWDTSAPANPYPYSVVQLQLGPDGKGEGRISNGVTVTSDTVLGVTLSDYAKAPKLLADVRRERT